jgi:hypothetical protein
VHAVVGVVLEQVDDDRAVLAQLIEGLEIAQRLGRDRGRLVRLVERVAVAIDELVARFFPTFSVSASRIRSSQVVAITATRSSSLSMSLSERSFVPVRKKCWSTVSWRFTNTPLSA